MKLQFRGLATVCALIFSALALTLMFAPKLLVVDWGIDVTLSVEVICRRAAALFAGFAVMFFLAKDAEPSAARSALINGAVVVFGLLASLGLYELKMGNATPAILGAVVIEVPLMLAFLALSRRQPATLAAS